ncbi:MAG TPA: hypothetical protein VJX29_00535, partial [Candidatus Acidoferrales bacterium]|nr:hypothetical protein [Candidatus Acidoferrales bacterium]
MHSYFSVRSYLLGALAIATMLLAGSAFAADHFGGQVLGGGAPIGKSTVTLWEASAGAPRKLAETKTNEDGRFEIRTSEARSGETFLYLVATGGVPRAQKASDDNPAIVLLAVLGNKPPEKVTVDEFTTIASVWTNAQFLSGATLQGHALGLRIAAGNVPNLVDLETGGLGPVIQDPLNSTQTTTLSLFSTLGDLLAGCITRVQSDACAKLFEASTPPGG